MLAHKLNNTNQDSASLLPQVVKVRLIKSIDYRKDGELIVIEANKELHMDTVKQCVLYNGDHVSIFSDEYELI